MSSVTALGEFDIFGVPPTQTTIEQDILSEHRPVAPINSKSSLEFNIVTGIDEYLRLDKSWLYIKVKLICELPMKAEMKKDNWKSVSTVNNFLNSLFKQVDLYIGSYSVSLSHQTYPYKADFEIKLGKSKESKESYLSSILWTHGEDETSDYISQKRAKFIESNGPDFTIGKEVDLMGRIHLPLFEQNKAVLGGTTITLKFIPNDPSFYIMCKNDVNIKSVEFSDATLYVHRSKVTRPVVEAQNKGLEITNAKYPVRESFVVPTTISAGKQDFIIENVHSGYLPQRAFVAFVDHSAFNGSYVLNPFYYEHFNLSYLAFNLNGIQYPEKAFTPNYDKSLYMREYLSLFEATNQDNIDTCITSNRENYVRGNNIYAVNFTPDLSSGCCSTGYVNPRKNGTLRLHLGFRRPLPKAITVLVYLEFDSIIEINRERNLIYFDS